MFASARVRIVYIPDDVSFPASDIDVMRFKNVIVDIKGTTEYSLFVPYLSRYPSLYTTVAEFPRTLDFAEYAFGRVFVQLLNPIQNFSSGSTADIGVVVFGSMGEDAVFANLREVYWNPVQDIYFPTAKKKTGILSKLLPEKVKDQITVPQPGFTHNDDGSRTIKHQEVFIKGRYINQVLANTDLVGLFSNTFPSMGPVNLTVPDKVNLADVGTRWTEVFSRSISVVSDGIGSSGTYYSIQGLLAGSRFSWLFAMFRVLRGSVRVKIIPRTPGRLAAVDVRGLSVTNPNEVHNLSGWTYGDEITRQPIEFVVPYYRNCLYFNASTRYYKGQDHFDNWGFYVQTTDSSTMTIEILLSLGPDFRVGLPIVCPPVEVIT
jgi:hypothetical protein